MHYHQLTETERHQIYAFRKAGLSQSDIAQELKRSKSTIYREFKRNTGLRGYRPHQAQRLADVRKTLHSHTLIKDET